jgi:hypothetical protein
LRDLVLRWFKASSRKAKNGDQENGAMKVKPDVPRADGAAPAIAGPEEVNTYRLMGLLVELDELIMGLSHNHSDEQAKLVARAKGLGERFEPQAFEVPASLADKLIQGILECLEAAQFTCEVLEKWRWLQLSIQVESAVPMSPLQEALRAAREEMRGDLERAGYRVSEEE